MSPRAEGNHTRFIRSGLEPPLRYLDFTNLVAELYRDSPKIFERHEVGIAFEIIRETRTDSGTQCDAIEQMIKGEATPFWSHAIHTAGSARVVVGLLVTVASGIDALVNGSLISIVIASAGFGASFWGLAPIRRGAIRIATAERDLELYETYVGRSEAARDRMIELGYSEAP